MSPCGAVYSVTSPVWLFLSTNFCSTPLPDTSTTSVLKLTFILSCFFSSSTTDWAQENLAFLTLMVTDFAYLVRKMDSSTAANPPPITNTSLPVKNSPSQVAQYATPRPRNSSSPVNPILRGWAPVAITTASVRYSCLVPFTIKVPSSCF